MTNNIQINDLISSNLIISKCEDENKNNNKSNFDNFINSKLKLQYILEYEWITFSYIINEFANGCFEFRKILENGGVVDEIESIDINDGKGFTSRLLRLIINIKYNNGINNKSKNFPNQFSLILKIFADERIEVLVEHFIGKERLEKMILEVTKKLAIKENNEENLNNNCKNNEEINNKIILTKEDKMNTMKESMVCFRRMHQNECLFYEMMKNIENPPLPLPKIYFTKICLEEKNEGEIKEGPQGVILMEDLTENTHIAPLTKGLNEIQIMEVIKYLAHLHAYLSLPKIKEKWQKEFTTIEKMWEQTFSEDFNKAIFEQIMELDENILEPFKKIGILINNPEFTKWMKEKCEDEYGVPEILTHGDLWNNNLLWYDNDPNRIAAFIDWQLATIGNPMADVSRLMLATVEPDLRHKIEKEGKILKLYLNELNKKLVEQGMKKVNYGIEKLQHVYNLAIITQAVGRVLEIPFFERGTPENHPEFKEKMECIRKRAILSINDAVKIMETEASEWLNKYNEEKNEINK